MTFSITTYYYTDYVSTCIVTFSKNFSLLWIFEHVWASGWDECFRRLHFRYVTGIAPFERSVLHPGSMRKSNKFVSLSLQKFIGDEFNWWYLFSNLFATQSNFAIVPLTNWNVEDATFELKAQSVAMVDTSMSRRSNQKRSVAYWNKTFINQFNWLWLCGIPKIAMFKTLREIKNNK